MLNLFQHLHQMNEIPTFVGMTNAERINLNSLFFLRTWQCRVPTYNI